MHALYVFINMFCDLVAEPAFLSGLRHKYMVLEKALSERMMQLTQVTCVIYDDAIDPSDITPYMAFFLCHYLKH